MKNRRDFTDKSELANELAKQVAINLNAGIKARGKASLAVSGGSTPKMLFAALSQIQDVNWSNVTITLVDERWVDASSERSNALLVAQHLLQGSARAAQFLPLYSGGDLPTDSRVEQTNIAFDDGVEMPFDAVILGMGNDGHTASFFPGGDTLNLALSSDGPAIAINAPGAGEARITLTLPTLMDTKNLYLHIEGQEKAKTLQKALSAGDVAQMPVRAFLYQSKIPLQIFWCP